MGKEHWDAIVASAPLNVTAATVTAKGIHFDPKAASPEVSWDAPPLLVKITSTHRSNPSFVDFTGQHIGRLAVLGMVAGASKPGMGALWACRCVCGRYVGRRAKGLKNKPDDAMCNHCNYSRHLRFAASGDQARKRAESEKARKW